VSREGLTLIWTDLRTGNDKSRDNGKSNDEMQGSFAPLRMTTKTDRDYNSDEYGKW
jgi:hypothetical protein